MNDPAAPPPRVPERSTTGLEPRLAAALAYLLWFVSGLLILALERDSPFVRFHAAQSTLMSLVLALWLLLVIVFDLPRIPVIGLAAYLAAIPAALGLWLLLMFRAFQGERFELPLIAGLARRASRS